MRPLRSEAVDGLEDAAPGLLEQIVAIQDEGDGDLLVARGAGIETTCLGDGTLGVIDGQLATCSTARRSASGKPIRLTSAPIVESIT